MSAERRDVMHDEMCVVICAEVLAEMGEETRGEVCDGRSARMSARSRC